MESNDNLRQRSLFLLEGTDTTDSQRSDYMRFASLFAGIGGFEKGLSASGHSCLLSCEILPAAQAVLRANFPDLPIHGDVKSLAALPSQTELLAAGFPCQDLSQAGRTKGLAGAQSGLITEVFRLAESCSPEWVLLENVPFMLQLNKGAAIRAIVSRLDELGYRWAWRVVDTFAFGLPQRRGRVIILGSKQHDPANVLFADDNPLVRPASKLTAKAHGFYWTEGRTGLGWAADAIPTLKSGSSLGIPSPPAILLPDGSIIKPDLRDAERLQGFSEDWTLAAQRLGRGSVRWSLVGNALSVPVAEWLGERLARPGKYDIARDRPFDETKTLPRAARSHGHDRKAVEISTDPLGILPPSLTGFLNHPGEPLSQRASTSFLARTRLAKLRFQPGFIEAVEKYVADFSSPPAAEAA